MKLLVFKKGQVRGVEPYTTGGLTLLFEGEVLCEVPALMVASEEEQGVGMVDLKSPQVQYTLWRRKHTHTHSGEK